MALEPGLFGKLPGVVGIRVSWQKILENDNGLETELCGEPESYSAYYRGGMGVLRQNNELLWSISIDKAAVWLGPTPNQQTIGGMTK